MEENIRSIIAALNQRNLPLALDVIQQELRSKGSLGVYSVEIANRLMGAFPWEIVSRLLPPETNFFETSGWLGSIKNSAPLNVQGLPLPWLNYSCIDFLWKFLAQRSVSIFEWGSGFSTLFFKNHASYIRSCEDNKEWYSKVKSLAENTNNLELVYRPTKDDYLAEISGSFDLIVIDGSHRTECLKVAPEFLNSDGLILLDNSDDNNLDSAILHLDREGFFSISFTGLIPSYAYKNVSTVFFRDPKILKLNRSETPSATSFPSGITCFQAMEKLRKVSEFKPQVKG